MVSAGSCQKEITDGIDDGGAKVSLTLQTVDQQTRAIADASNIDILHWEIYPEDILDAAKPLAKGSERDTDGDGVFTLDLSLILDQTYNFIFWAQVDPEEGKEHYDVSDLRRVGIKTYDDEKANDESRAAFFAHETIHVSGSIEETITLYRPFSQLNLGTETYDVSSLNLTESLKVNYSEVTAYGIADTFNTITGEGEGSREVHFQQNITPNGDEDAVKKILEVNNTSYYWLGMNYLIVNGNSDNVKVDMKFHTTHGEVELSIDNVPVKENYRTNIIGDLLTSEAFFKIVVDEKFQTPDNIVGDEGGSEEGGETPVPNFVITQDGDDLTYTVFTPEGLEAWRQAAHQDALDDTDRKINLILGADIILEYIEGEANWTPVGTYDHPYDGTIDGAGHYISDMSIDSEGEPAGFIGAWDGEEGGIVAQNLIFRNVHILSSNKYGTGTVVGYGHKKYIIKDCHVKGGSVSGIGGGPCGGLFGGGFETGFDQGASGSGKGFGGTAIRCTNSASVITSTITYYVGGIGGFGNAIDCTNTGTVTGSGYYIGGILGGSNGQVTGNKNQGKVTGGVYAGGIVGGIKDGTLENNSNFGDVYGSEEGKLGGIFGWLDESSTTQSGNTYQCIVKVIVVDQDFTVKVEPEVTTYTVYTAEGLEMWRAAAHQNAVDKKSDKVNLLLAADIELPVVEEGSSNWTPLGTTSAPYNGIIDGAGFTISNLTISGGSNVGFIGAASYGGNVVTNLKLDNVNISGAKNVGAVIGQVTNDGKVDNCHVLSGKVTGTGDNVGGILGYSKNYGGVSNSSNEAEISGASYVGGIAGHAYGSYCVNTGKVTGTGDYVGGIFAYKTWSVSGTSNNKNFGDVVGKNYVGGIAGACGQSNSYNEGTIIGEKYVGGISGSMSLLEGTSTQCINKGEVIGVENVGGICGTTGNRSHITQAVNEGKVTGEQYVGGIAGSFGGALSGKARNLTDCRNTAEVIGKAYVGGILGYNSGSSKNPITGNINEADITGEDKVAGIVAYNNNAIVTNNTNSGNISGYTNLGQIVGEQNASYTPDIVTGNVSNGTVTILENSDFTRTVNGTTVSYIAYTQKGFEAWVAEAHKSVEEGYACDLTLETDIVLPLPADGESNWTPIGNYAGTYTPNHYNGNIDGKGHTISNITVKTDVRGAGFIGQINGGSIKNLNLSNVNIHSTSSYVAGIAAVVPAAAVRIENCHILNGTIQSSGQGAAGIVGVDESSLPGRTIIVVNCTNKANITGNGNYVGGIGGYVSCDNCQNYGTIINNTTKSGYTGGITGRGDVTGSTNSGNVTSYKTVAGITGSGDVTDSRNSGNITGTDIEVAGISGIGNVTNSHNTGNIYSTGQYAAGIVGQGGATGCTNSGKVTGKTCVGGISGTANAGDKIISNCINSGDVIATGDYAGGIVGRKSGNVNSNITELTNCENSGKVTSSANYVGGIIGGFTKGQILIKESTNRGDVSGNDYVGGIAGSSMTVTDCDNYGDVDGNQSVGGISGAKYDAAHTISGSENHGAVTGVSYLGGIVGFADAGTVTGNTHSGKVSGQDKVGGIVGYNEEATVTYNTHAGEAEALTNVAAIVAYQDPSFSPDIVTGNVDNGTETLLAPTDYTREVNGSDIYYKVYTASGLLTWMQEAAEGASSNSKIVHLELMADVTLPADAVWAQIGNSSRYYKGNVNGNNHTISKFTITNGLTHAGFIGALDGGTVKNLKFADVSITSTNNYGAVIVGTLRSGTVENCHVLGGTVTIGPYSGGLVGNVSNKGASILNCSNAAAIYSSKQYAGGIVGHCSANSDNRILIDGCVNTGIIHSTSNDVAGIVGYANYTDISNCSNKSDLTAASTTGGIVGIARYSTITYCVNIGNVTSSNVCAGGIAGSASSSTTVSSNVNKGTVTANYETGGIVGEFTDGMVSANTNEGNVRYVRNSYNGLIVGKHSGGTIADDNIAGGQLIQVQ